MFRYRFRASAVNQSKMICFQKKSIMIRIYDYVRSKQSDLDNLARAWSKKTDYRDKSEFT